MVRKEKMEVLAPSKAWPCHHLRLNGMAVDWNLLFSGWRGGERLKPLPAKQRLRDWRLESTDWRAAL